MATASVTFESLRQDIAKRKFAPVYLLHGQEGYYTDVLVKDFENVLPEADREFNQYVLYATQTEPSRIMNICSRVPMMAERQVVIVKEAQAVRADQINQLHKYVTNALPSTLLVIVFRGDDAKGKDLIAAVKKHGVIFESKKVRDYQLPQLIASHIKTKGLTADPKSLEMLRDFIGTDLSRLYNEIDKLQIVLGPGANITPQAVERNIGVSKDYNTFELLDALAVRDAGKVMRVEQYFASNPKAIALPAVTTTLYNMFSDVLIGHYTRDKSDGALMAALGYKSAFPLRRIRAAMQSYNAFQLIEIIWALRQFDCRSKGNGSRQDANALFHDLLFHILSAPGNLGV